MTYATGSLFPDEEKRGREQKDDFAASCRPLSEMLDSVRHVEGFPLGRDEDILALSDPPYYTACPNPYIWEFIKHYGKPYDEATDTYERTPYVSDVSEGKNDPVYNAHSYHTKVPHKAIMKYIEHYTEEGDIVFDGFCGTGMTGVAAQLLNRRAVLCDLSPAATFIAYNYNAPVDVVEFEREAKRILSEVEKECGWMYETIHTDGRIKGKINYTVWSDVFICPYCGGEYVFWEAAVDKEKGKVNDKYPCPSCGALVNKRDCRRATVTFYDQAIGKEVTQARQVPVLINYTVGIKRSEKKPDQFDLDLIRKIEESAIPYWFPTDRMPEGDESRRNDKMGITHVHHFYTKRNLWIISALANTINSQSNDLLKKALYFVLTGILQISSKQSSFRYDSRNPQNTAGGILKGTLYVPSLPREGSIFENFKRRCNFIKSMMKVKSRQVHDTIIIETTSVSQTSLIDSFVDYIFTDPPFGDNLMYSELNFLWRHGIEF